MRVKALLADHNYSVQRDLALVKNRQSGRWQVIDTRREPLPPAAKVIRGVALVQLMRAVANGAPQHPVAVSDQEYRALATDRSFRQLCQHVPGLESAAHRSSRARVSQAKERALHGAKAVGRGLAKVERRQQQDPLFGGVGRYVGQEQGEHPYWIRELLFQGGNRLSTEVSIVVDAWHNDSTTMLSIGEWEQAKREEWQLSASKQPFLSWLVASGRQQQDKAAWHKAHPGQPFDQKAFDAWKLTQVDPVLGPPLWLLKEMSGASDDAGFQAWRSQIIKERREGWEKFKEKQGAYDLTFADYEQFSLDFTYSGSTDKIEHWILEKLWQKTTAQGKTSDDLDTFILRGIWQRDTKAGKTHDDFDQWRVNQEQALRDRHRGTHSPLPFAEWKAQQYDSVLEPPAPFILLDEQQRQTYRTSCDHGVLTRNGHPLDTQHEETRHSGRGYAIFVIGPDEDLYSGSHILGVFHHSSFLGEGATIAAGEIKTRPDGTMAALSSKSGHYQPNDAQNLYLLRYFRDRGVDLASVEFTKFGPQGTETYNAQAFLDILEHQAALGQIDMSLFE